MHVCMCVCVVVETSNVKLNRSGSIESAGFSHLTTWPQPLEYNFHNLIIKQRILNSKMTRAELESGSFATGNVLNLDDESAG